MKKKKEKKYIKNIEILKSEEISVICNNCKDVIIFINGQETKTCPSCGAVVQNTKIK